MSRDSFWPDGVWQFHESGSWLVKGDHTKESAVAAINDCIAAECDIGCYSDDYPEPLLVDDVWCCESRWWRWVPAPRGDDNYPCYLHEAEPHARGAFQAAMLD